MLSIASTRWGKNGAAWMTPEERLQPVTLKPEMASLDCGTVNFGDEYIVNTLPIMRDLRPAGPTSDRTAAMARAEEFVKKNLALAVLIDTNIKAVTTRIDEVNRTPKAVHSVLSFPVFYHLKGSKHIAYVPGVVNQLILRKHLLIPDPKIKAFRDHITTVARKVGLVPHFLDDMVYHTLEGEIHCGTNVFRHPNRYVVQPKNLPPELAPRR